MPVATETVVVQGLRDLSQAFRVADKTLAKELRVSLRRAVEPVRADAERLALQQIPKIGVPWSRMRIGVTTTSVYLAPRQRGVKSRTDRSRRRPNLADLLLGRSMVPALEQNEPNVVARVDDLLGTVAQAWETA